MPALSWGSLTSGVDPCNGRGNFPLEGISWNWSSSSRALPGVSAGGQCCKEMPGNKQVESVLHHSRGEVDAWCKVLGKNRDTRSDVVDQLILISVTIAFSFFKPSFFSCFEGNSSWFFWLAGETKVQSRQGALA